MREVISTLFLEHNLFLVGLAALVCALAAFAATTLLSHARRTDGGMQKVWLAVAAVSTGSGIWATHFIAMLAFEAGFPVGYDIGLTILSLVVAVAFSGAGLWMAAAGTRTGDAALGGAIAGLGISAMHYIGMASLLVGGQMAWDGRLVAASIVLGAMFGALAFHVTLSGGRARTVSGALLMTLAICAMHFTAMGAAGFENCFPVVAPNNGVAQVLMPSAVALASLLILVFALGGVHLEMRERLRLSREAGRMRELANAAVEGLVVCAGSQILTVNESLAEMAGLTVAGMTGRPITDFLGEATIAGLPDRAGEVVEAELTGANGNIVPVELVARPVEYEGKRRQAIAVRDLRARKQAEQYIRFLAHHDALTGLPNRASFTERLDREIKRARRHNTRLAVLCLDLDRFKEINDLFGHATGDELLKRVATCLNQPFYEGQYAARLSGDEFVMLLPEIGSPAEAGRVAADILEAFAADNDTSAADSRLAASIGIAAFPENADTAAELMNNADTALYRAKQDGRGRYCYFEDAMGIEVRDRRKLEHELRQAIGRDQLKLVYQPQVRIETNELTGFEALLRWTHPERGEISPSVFVPLAEESGLILQIGEWVLETACREAASWKNPLSVAVNVSAVQLHNEYFPQRLHEVLLKTGLSPKRLEIEITETALVRDMARALANLAQIKALGVRIAMDDFGTGYSSLSNLRAFAFDKIKIDQSFIRAVDRSEQSATIVKAVLGLGRGLNLPVLAEGVERSEELAFLKGEICAEAQGYLVGRPVDIGSFTDFTHGDRKLIDSVATGKAVTTGSAGKRVRKVAGK